MQHQQQQMAELILHIFIVPTFLLFLQKEPDFTDLSSVFSTRTVTLVFPANRTIGKQRSRWLSIVTSISQLFSSHCCSFDDRIFSTKQFWSEHATVIRPVGIHFFQTSWDSSVTTTFQNILGNGQ